MTKCPRCNREFEHVRALSRTDNKTAVCDSCGMDEGIQAMHDTLVPQHEWPTTPMTLALLLKANGEAGLIQVEAVGRVINHLVGGYFESVRVPDHDAHAYVNEDGIRLGLPPNENASLLLRQRIVGDAVVFGTGAEPEEADVPMDLALLLVEGR